MILLTGGAGFIGSVVLKHLNDAGRSDIIVVDSLGVEEKWQNLNGKVFEDFFHKEFFYELLIEGKLPEGISSILHLGACSSTTEMDGDYLMENNFKFSKLLAEYAEKNNIPMIYASSAATYGDGSLGFSDTEEISRLLPLNGYGFSKQIFDQWVLSKEWSNQMVGLKFFNVYGPNEYHKGSMMSVVNKAFYQIQKTGKIKLFKSEHPDYKDGEQMRDFVYVKDVAETMLWLMEHKDISGLFNLGCGTARTWVDLARAVFSAMGKEENIQFVDLPDELKGRYQYYTEAPMDKLLSTGCKCAPTSLEDGVNDYVVNHLMKERQYY